MGNSLPEIERSLFVEQIEVKLHGLSCGVSSSTQRDLLGDSCGRVGGRLYDQYEELRRWNSRLSLVGPGTADEVVTRHYGEALEALPLLGSTEGQVLVDLGSGAGFPAIVLAAARPDLQVYLIEAREKKWAFLKSVARRCGLSCHCLNARVGKSLPSGLPDRIDLVTSRAVSLSRSFFEIVIDHSPKARFLLWQGEMPLDLPPGARVTRTVHLAGSQCRQILEIQSGSVSSG